MKKQDCHRLLKRTKQLVYGGWLVMLVSIFAGTSSESIRGVMFYPIMAGFLISVVALGYGLYTIKCPNCRTRLMSGTKIPKELPEVCPHCGEQL